MKKWVLRITFIILLISLLFIVRFIGGATSLPDKSEELISASVQTPPTDLYLGKTYIVDNNGIKIWYESFTPQDSIKGTVLLIMGHSTTALNWPQYFYSPLVKSGYRVIRYDNRGVGMSDWMKKWTEENAYDLSDMVTDGLSILNKEGIDKAHITGVSMGGMIAQQMAIDYPERVLSLTSIMSSGFINDPELPPVPVSFIRDLQKLGIKYLLFRSEKNLIRFTLGVAEILKGDGSYNTDVQSVINRSLFEIRERQGFNPHVGNQHSKAIELSGSRYSLLPQLDLPVLVIHGKSDPLIPFAHAEKMVALIPGAEMLWIDGMGHDIPRIYTRQIHEAMYALFEKDKR